MLLDAGIPILFEAHSLSRRSHRFSSNPPVHDLLAPLMLCKRVYQRVFARKIDYARNAQRIQMDRIDSLRAEDGLAVCPCDPKAFANVFGGLFFVESADAATEHDALRFAPFALARASCHPAVVAA
jgi:hypothetical protein